MKWSPFLPWLALGGLLVTALVWSRPLSPGPTRIDDLPKKGMTYQSVDLPLEGGEEDFFRGARVVKRLYRLVDRSTLVVIGIDGSGNRHAVHDPLFCFRGGGWVTRSTEPVTLAYGAGRHIRLERGPEKWEAIYWFSDGHTQHASPVRAWLQSAVRRMTRGYSGPEPILIVIQPGDASQIPWDSAGKWFSSLLEW